MSFLRSCFRAQVVASALALTPALLSGCAEVEPDAATLSAPLIGAPTSSNTVHPAAGAVVVKYNGMILPLCTGTLIAPDVVLTAAHCLGDWWWPEGLVPSFTFAEDITSDGVEVVPGIRMHRHPGYDMAFTGFELMGDQHDIGVLVLERPITDVEPAPIATQASDLSVGMELEITGYGLVDNDGDEGSVRRYGETSILEIGSGEFMIAHDGVTTCSGDSGGAFFAADSTESPGMVIGVVSRSEGEVDGCEPEQNNLATRVDTHAQWIRDVAGLAAPASGVCYVQANIENLRYRLRSDGNSGLLDAWTRYAASFAFAVLDLSEGQGLARWAIAMDQGVAEFTAKVPQENPVDPAKATYQQGTVKLAIGELTAIPEFDYQGCADYCRSLGYPNEYNRCIPGCDKRKANVDVARYVYWQGTAALDDGVRSGEAEVWVAKVCLDGSKADELGGAGLDIDSDDTLPELEEEAGGCSAGGVPSSGALSMLFGLLAALALRRRRAGA